MVRIRVTTERSVSFRYIPSFLVQMKMKKLTFKCDGWLCVNPVCSLKNIGGANGVESISCHIIAFIWTAQGRASSP